MKVIKLVDMKFNIPGNGVTSSSTVLESREVRYIKYDKEDLSDTIRDGIVNAAVRIAIYYLIGKFAIIALMYVIDKYL